MTDYTDGPAGLELVTPGSTNLTLVEVKSRKNPSFLRKLKFTPYYPETPTLVKLCL